MLYLCFVISVSNFCQIQLLKTCPIITFKTCAISPWSWWVESWQFCSYGQPDVPVPRCLVQEVSWQQCPHCLEWNGDGPKMSVRLTVFLRDRQCPAYIGLRGSHGLGQGLDTWQQHPHCHGRSEDGPIKTPEKCRDGPSLSMLDCEVDKDNRTEEDLIWPGYAARCQEPPCLQSWWPSVTACAHAREAAAWFCFGPKSRQLTKSVFIYHLEDSHHHSFQRGEEAAW